MAPWLGQLLQNIFFTVESSVTFATDMWNCRDHFGVFVIKFSVSQSACMLLFFGRVKTKTILNTHCYTCVALFHPPFCLSHSFCLSLYFVSPCLSTICYETNFSDFSTNWAFSLFITVNQFFEILKQCIL